MWGSRVGNTLQWLKTKPPPHNECALAKDELEEKPAQRGFNGGCKDGFRQLNQWLGGNVWRALTSWRAVGGGQKRLAGLTVAPSVQALRGGGGGASSARLVLAHDPKNTAHDKRETVTLGKDMMHCFFG